jgi:hypothetical protein
MSFFRFTGSRNFDPGEDVAQQAFPPSLFSAW